MENSYMRRKKNQKLIQSHQNVAGQSPITTIGVLAVVFRVAWLRLSPCSTACRKSAAFEGNVNEVGDNAATMELQD